MSDLKAKDAEIAKLKRYIFELGQAIDDAEYALVGGNLARENVPYGYVEGWFNRIQSIRYHIQMEMRQC